MQYKDIAGVPPSTSPRGFYRDTQTGKIYWVNSDTANPRSVRYMATVGAVRKPRPKEPNPKYNIEFVRSQLESGETLEQGYQRLLERFEVLMNAQRTPDYELSADEAAEYQLLSRSLLVGG